MSSAACLLSETCSQHQAIYLKYKRNAKWFSLCHTWYPPQQHCPGNSKASKKFGFSIGCARSQAFTELGSRMFCEKESEDVWMFCYRLGMGFFMFFLCFLPEISMSSSHHVSVISFHFINQGKGTLRLRLLHIQVNLLNDFHWYRLQCGGRWNMCSTSDPNLPRIFSMDQNGLIFGVASAILTHSPDTVDLHLSKKRSAFLQTPRSP